MAKLTKTTPPSALSTGRESVPAPRLSRLIEGFLLHGDVSGHSHRTIDNRRRRLGALTWFV
jgi:hypothetical protein